MLAIIQVILNFSAQFLKGSLSEGILFVFEKCGGCSEASFDGFGDCRFILIHLSNKNKDKLCAN